VSCHTHPPRLDSSNRQCEIFCSNGVSSEDAWSRGSTNQRESKEDKGSEAVEQRKVYAAKKSLREIADNEVVALTSVRTRPICLSSARN
jgi:hypothetical protein